MDLAAKACEVKCEPCVPALLLSPTAPSPLTLSIPGVWRQGPGLKNVEEKNHVFLLVLKHPHKFSLDGVGVVVSFLVL